LPTCLGPPCGCNNQKLWILFWISTTTSSLEYYLGIPSGSSSVQADAMHALVHSLWYGSPLWINIWARARRFSGDQEAHLIKKWMPLNRLFLFVSLGKVAYEALKKFWYFTPIASDFFMLVGGLVGLLGGFLQLQVLNKIKQTDAVLENKRYQSFRIDTLGDVWISVVVVAMAASLSIIKGTQLESYSTALNVFDPVFTLLVVIVIGHMGYRLFRSS